MSGEVGDDDSDDTVIASVVFLLILLFVVVGSIGSHLTRAAFVERLVIVVVFRLLVVAVVVVLMGLRDVSRWAEVRVDTLPAFSGDNTASRPLPPPPLPLPKGVDFVRTWALSSRWTRPVVADLEWAREAFSWFNLSP